jgi:hypothetical protein
MVAQLTPESFVGLNTAPAGKDRDSENIVII